METITIPLADLTDRDIQYIDRIVHEQNERVTLKTDGKRQECYIQTQFIDTAQHIAQRLITCGVAFTYEPK